MNSKAKCRKNFLQKSEKLSYLNYIVYPSMFLNLFVLVYCFVSTNKKEKKKGLETILRYAAIETEHSQKILEHNDWNV